MTGYQSKPGPESRRSEPPAGGHIHDLSAEEIRALVRRGHALRSATVHDYLSRLFGNWRAVFRRPGRITRTTHPATPHRAGA